MHKYPRLGAILCALSVTYIIVAAKPTTQKVLLPASLYVNSSSRDKVVGLKPAQVRHAYTPGVLKLKFE